MKGPRFEVYPDKGGQYRWRLKAANGRIIATGEAHPRKADAERAVRTVQRAAAATVRRGTRLSNKVVIVQAIPAPGDSPERLKALREAPIHQGSSLVRRNS